MDYAERWRAANPEKVWRHGLSCVLCDWPAHVQGGDFGDVGAVLHEHQREHPEWAEFQASLPTLEEVTAAIHANCNHRAHPCPCICGCGDPLACDCWSVLCSTCQIRDMRGDHGHGMPAA